MPCNRDTICSVSGPTEGCFNKKLTPQQVKSIFEAFWGLADNDKQNQYLLGCITPREVKRRRTANFEKPDKQQWTYSVGADNIVVCRHAFKSIHGINDGKLRVIMGMKKNSQENVVIPDMRGKSKFLYILLNIF